MKFIKADQCAVTWQYLENLIYKAKDRTLMWNGQGDQMEKVQRASKTPQNFQMEFLKSPKYLVTLSRGRQINGLDGPFLTGYFLFLQQYNTK